MVKQSPTGCVFAFVFLAVAVWCLGTSSHGDGGSLWLLNFLTLPVSYGTALFGSYLQVTYGLSYDVVGWAAAVLDVLWGFSMFYFFGWLLERPLRR